MESEYMADQTGYVADQTGYVADQTRYMVPQPPPLNSVLAEFKSKFTPWDPAVIPIEQTRWVGNINDMSMLDTDAGIAILEGDGTVTYTFERAASLRPSVCHGQYVRYIYCICGNITSMEVCHTHYSSTLFITTHAHCTYPVYNPEHPRTGHLESDIAHLRQGYCMYRYNDAQHQETECNDAEEY